MNTFDKTILTRTVKKDMVMIGVLLAICIILMFANFWYIMIQDKQDKIYINISGEMRILSQSIAKHAANAADGLQEAFDLLGKRRDDFDEGLLTLKKGDAKLSLNASEPLIAQNELATLESTWKKTRNKVDIILGRQALLLSLHQMAQEMRASVPKISEQYEHVIKILLANDQSNSQVNTAIKQAVLAQSIYQHVDKVLGGGQEAVQAADNFSRETTLFNKLHYALLNGSKALGIERVTLAKARDILQEISAHFEFIKNNIDLIRQASEEYALVNAAAFDIYIGSQTLLEQATTLSRAYTISSERRFIGEPTGYMLGLTCILLFIWLTYRGFSDARERLMRTDAQHKANRAAVWRLLDELSNLADGDLTVKATVSDDITGSIAESVNYAIDALRKLVFTINETAVMVSSSAQEAQTTSSHLASASQAQAREIVGATAAINTMARSIENVSSNAAESSSVAQESVTIAKDGVQVVQNTMSGMEKIREQIQETSKQIKRLGESTQEIGNIVALINDIADQTHVLAMNASIQAAMAGDAGRGFAVVAEEVQHLAERATMATSQIESLVSTIQTDTNETVKSMEQTTQEVVKGAKLSKEAGVALGRIEQVSLSLNSLIQTISEEAGTQAKTSSQVSRTMEVIKDIATQTAAGTSATANSIGHLAELAIELRESVAGFKLPLEEDEPPLSRVG